MLKTCSFGGLQVSRLINTKACDFSFDLFHGSLVIFILIIQSMITLYLRIYCLWDFIKWLVSSTNWDLGWVLTYPLHNTTLVNITFSLGYSWEWFHWPPSSFWHTFSVYFQDIIFWSFMQMRGLCHKITQCTHCCGFELILMQSQWK
jgi:hypothetical protein